MQSLYHILIMKSLKIVVEIKEITKFYVKYN
jgi:hypothetical protein